MINSVQFIEGADAYYEGTDLNSNPYKIHTAGYFDWREGFQDAWAEDTWQYQDLK